VLPRSLRSVAGAPKFGAEEKAGHSGRDDGAGKKRSATQEGGASPAPTKDGLDVEEPVVGIGGAAGLDVG
jgi:hypothetical protein